MNKTVFQTMVRRILTEEIQKRVPEMNGNGADPVKKNKTFSSDSNSRDDQLVRAIDKTWKVIWDDHDDLTVHAGDKVKVTITQLWEDYFKIIYMPRNEDRFFFTGLTWEQVKEFIKDNVDGKEHTNVEKARDKSWRNNEAQPQKVDKGLPQTDKPKVTSTDNPFTKEKNKDRRYVEDSVKDEKDLPHQPMRDVSAPKKQSEHKVKDPVRLRKRTPDKKLVVKS
jgi:hypothetical protein